MATANKYRAIILVPLELTTIAMNPQHAARKFKKQIADKNIKLYSKNIDGAIEPKLVIVEPATPTFNFRPHKGAA